MEVVNNTITNPPTIRSVRQYQDQPCFQYTPSGVTEAHKILPTYGSKTYNHDGGTSGLFDTSIRHFQARELHSRFHNCMNPL